MNSVMQINHLQASKCLDYYFYSNLHHALKLITCGGYFVKIIIYYCMRVKRDINKRNMIESHRYVSYKDYIGWILCLTCISLNECRKLKKKSL